MRTRASLAALTVMLAGAVWVGAARTQPEAGPFYTMSFRLQDAVLLPIGASPYYFSLQPGRFWRYEGMDGEEFVELEIRTLPQVKWITFQNNGQPLSVLTRVIEEREWVDGELIEVSRNFFARDVGSRNTFYFGEEVDIYQNGQIVSHDGAWQAGVNGAKPGLIMPGMYLLGSRYFQEIAPGVAMDRAENVEAGVAVTTKAGNFVNCVVIRETTPLEPGSEGFKTFAPGVGMIKDGLLELVEYH